MKKCDSIQCNNVKDLFKRVQDLSIDINHIENLQRNFKQQLSVTEQALRERYNYSIENVTICHFIPLSRGGINRAYNLTPSLEKELTQIYNFLQKRTSNN
jgi:hypothetical protein